MRKKTRGAPRDGELLLTGIAWCGRCGHKTYARYKTRPEYVCNHLSAHQGLPACQYISAPRVDAAVSQAFLTALAPAEIDALSGARRAQSQTDKAMRKSAEQQLERPRYETALAERQFNRVDPYNRLDVKMRVGSMARLTRGDEMQQRVIELAHARMHDDEIAGIDVRRTSLTELRRQNPADHRPAHTLSRLASRGPSSNGRDGSMPPTC